MNDIEYKIISLVKDADERNKTITYQEIISIMIQDNAKTLDIRNAIIKLIHERSIQCQSNDSDLDMISPLILKRHGKRSYKKEYKLRNPKPLSWWKRMLSKQLYITILIVVSIISMISGGILGAFGEDLYNWFKPIIQTIIKR